MSDKLSYSVREATAALGISRATLYRLMERGEIRSFKIGTRTLMMRGELEAFLGRHAGPAAEGSPGLAAG
jgi:excisionase family DNA binding protein